MSFRNKVKNNIPRVELHSITSLVAGGYKSGKTRLWKEVVELHYDNPDEALLIAFEDGYETWELENVLPIHGEGTGSDLYKVWDYFVKTVVPELVKEATEGRIVKLIGIDTADRAIDACTAWVLNECKKKFGRKFDSLQDVSESTNGKINGWTELYDELKKPFDALKNAGYGIFSLAWTKEKETTLYNGMKYNSIQLAMNNTGKKVFESQASLICCLQNEVLVLSRDGEILEENQKDKKGREKGTNFHETKPVMLFRPSEFVDIAGGRFTDLPEKVDYSAENFLQVFEDAVKGNLKKTKKPVAEIKKQQQEEREELVKESLAEQVKDQTIDSLIEQIQLKVKDLKLAEKKVLATKFEEAVGVKDFTTLKTVDDLNKVLAIVNS